MAKSEFLSAVMRLFALLTDDERLDVMIDYCAGCGTDDTSCQCQNDE